MQAKRRSLRQNFFICLRAPAIKKNKIDFDEKTDDFAEMKAFYIFHEGVFLLVLISVTVF